MFLKIFWAIFLVGFATVILFTSILSSASVNYSFAPQPANNPEAILKDEIVAYDLPFEGRILPDNPFWFLKSIRDRLWFWATTDCMKKAELNLLFADKRLSAVRVLFEKEEYGIGVLILLKAESYLREASLLEEECRKAGEDSRKFLGNITLSALKHKEVIDNLLIMAPAEAKPEIIKIKDITRDVFVRGRNAMQEKGEPVPKSPSEWD